VSYSVSGSTLHQKKCLGGLRRTSVTNEPNGGGFTSIALSANHCSQTTAAMLFVESEPAKKEKICDANFASAALTLTLHEWTF
jgi:hypothetical protein